MKKSLLTTMSFLCGLIAFAQVNYSPQVPTKYGDKVNRVKPLVSLHVPSGTTDLNDTDASPMIRVIGSELMFWDGDSWESLGGGSGGGVTSWFDLDELAGIISPNYGDVYVWDGVSRFSPVPYYGLVQTITWNVRDIICDRPSYDMVDGESFLVCESPASGGELDGLENQIVTYDEGTDAFTPSVPTSGQFLNNSGDQSIYQFDGTEWDLISSAKDPLLNGGQIGQNHFASVGQTLNYGLEFKTNNIRRWFLQANGQMQIRPKPTLNTDEDFDFLVRSNESSRLESIPKSYVFKRFGVSGEDDHVAPFEGGRSFNLKGNSFSIDSALLVTLYGPAGDGSDGGFYFRSKDFGEYYLIGRNSDNNYISITPGDNRTRFSSTWLRPLESGKTYLGDYAPSVNAGAGFAGLSLQNSVDIWGTTEGAANVLLPSDYNPDDYGDFSQDMEVRMPNNDGIMALNQESLLVLDATSGTADYDIIRGSIARIPIENDFDLVFTNLEPGSRGWVIFEQTTGGDDILSWPSGSVALNGTLAINTGSGDKTLAKYFYDGSTIWWEFPASAGGGGTSTRFGYTGEDDTQAEDRLFNGDDSHSINISDVYTYQVAGGDYIKEYANVRNEQRGGGAEVMLDGDITFTPAGGGHIISAPLSTYSSGGFDVIGRNQSTGRFEYVSAGGSYTDEQAQDAVGAMVDATLIYTDATPSLARAAISGDVVIASGSNTAAIGTGVIVNSDINASAAIDASKIGGGSVSTTEFNYLSSVTSDIQTQLNGKQASGSYLLAANNLSDLTTPATARINLGATTIGGAIYTLTNPSAVTFPRFNADNTVDALSASSFRTAIGAGTGNGDALVANPLSQFATTTSTQLNSVLSDESGTGNILTTNGSAASLTSFPTFNQNTTGSAATLTTSRNINGVAFNGSADITVTVPVSTGVSGLGSNIATWLATPSSSNLASAVTDETGTGAVVFANSPTLVTPALGTPSSVNLSNATALPLATGTSGILPDASYQYVKTALGGSYAATNTVTSSSTQYLTMFGSYANFNNENVRSWTVPYLLNGTVRSLTITTGTTQPASGSLIITIRKNTTNQSLTLTIPAGTTAGTFTDNTHSFSVSGNDVLSLEVVNGATSASAAVLSVSAVITNY